MYHNTMDHLHSLGACRGGALPGAGIQHLPRRGTLYVKPARPGGPARSGRTGSDQLPPDQLPPSDRNPGEPLTLADLFTFEVMMCCSVTNNSVGVLTYSFTEYRVIW